MNESSPGAFGIPELRSPAAMAFTVTRAGTVSRCGIESPTDMESLSGNGRQRYTRLSHYKTAIGTTGKQYGAGSVHIQRKTMPNHDTAEATKGFSPNKYWGLAPLHLYTRRRL